MATSITPLTNDLLALDLARVDQVLGKALTTMGREWTGMLPSPAAAPRAGEYALPGLRRIADVFVLSHFDCDVLLLAAAPEIDDRYAAACSALQRNSGLARPSVGLACRLLAQAAGATATAAFAALSPTSRLIANDLIRLIGDGPHATRAIALPRSVLLQLLDDHPAPEASIKEPSPALELLVLAPSTRRSAERAVALAQVAVPAETLVVVHGANGRHALARAIASELRRPMIAVAAGTTLDPARTGELARDARWWGVATILELGIAIPEIVRVSAELATLVIAVVESYQLRELVAATSRVVIEVAVEELEHPDRVRLWQQLGAGLDAPGLSALATRYRFGPGRIGATIALARELAASRGHELQLRDFAEASRSASATGGGLVQRLVSRRASDDLIVAPTTRRELAHLESIARYAHQAYAPDGAGARLGGSGGVVALFAGPSGTGKTLSAQIFANRLELDLLRIDLSQVVNKYIGETEKHLDQVFREGEATGAILFFDEADALFGKRTEIRDAHDRYANVETAFLLQRLETHPGVVILASNLRQNLDPAFVRRIHVIIDFEVPGPVEREAIWRRHLVPETLAPDVELGFLARFELAGGDIRNAATAAVFLAAHDGTPVTMVSLVIGVWRELSKAGRLSNADDFGPYRQAVVSYARGAG